MKILTLFILSFLCHKTLLGQEKLFDRARLFLTPIQVEPLDTYLQSQVMRILIKKAISTDKYDLIVGSVPKRLGKEIIAQQVQLSVKRKLDLYEIEVSLIDLKKKEKLKTFTKMNIPKDNFYPWVERYLTKVFFEFSQLSSRVLVKSQKSKSSRKKSSVVRIVGENQKREKFQSNIRIVKRERGKKKKRKKTPKYFKGRAEEIYGDDIEEEMETSSSSDLVVKKETQEASVPVKVETKEPEKIRKRTQSRAPFHLMGELQAESLDMESADLVPYVGNKNFRFGIKLGTQVFSFNEGRSELWASLSLAMYKDEAHYDQISKKLPFLFGASLDFQHRLSALPDFLGELGLIMNQRGFVNFHEVFKGLERGTLNYLWVSLGLKYEFQMFNFRHSLGVGYYYPLQQELKYGDLKTGTSIQSSQWRAFYIFSFSQTMEFEVQCKGLHSEERGGRFEFNEKSIGLFVRFLLSV